jgi:hypothetical protein
MQPITSVIRWPLSVARSATVLASETAKTVGATSSVARAESNAPPPNAASNPTVPGAIRAFTPIIAPINKEEAQSAPMIAAHEIYNITTPGFFYFRSTLSAAFCVFEMT